MGHRRIRNGLLLAAAMVVCGAETAGAGLPLTPQPAIEHRSIEHDAIDNRAPRTAAEPRTAVPAQEITPARAVTPTPEMVATPTSGLPSVAITMPETVPSPNLVPGPGPGALAPPEIVPAPDVSPGPAAPLKRPVVVLYGDSLAWEARHVFEQALADQPVTVVTRTFGGTAICDWHDEMAEDAATLQPGLVVVEFVGNNYTPCMRDAAGAPLVGAALVEQYGADAESAVAIFRAIDAQVVFAGAPISRPETATLDLHHAPLNAVYADAGRRLDGVRYVDAGAAVLDGGAWTDSLACLPVEPCANTSGESGTERNVVRAPDGLHFCPASAAADRGVTGDCPVWSSGAFRFGTAMAQPVLESVALATEFSGLDG